MTWALLGVFAFVAIIMVMNSRGSVPWGKLMRRAQVSDRLNRSEWMAPDDVVAQVRDSYLVSTRWLADVMLAPLSRQWAGAPNHLSGAYLKRFQTILAHQRTRGIPRFIGVLRVDHQLTVRQFSEDGERCLLIDHQTQRRMASYDAQTHERVTTQDMGDGVVVYRMRFDTLDNRWKIDEFVQELPLGWGRHTPASRVRELSALPSVIGRDN